MDFESLLTQMETTRPDLADSLTLLRNFHRSNQDKDRREDEEPADPEPGDGRSDLLERQKTLNRQLLKQYELLKENYELLVCQLDELADATGACPQCWGEDPGCRHCRGRGKPGYSLPDRELFEKYVKPVIIRISNTKKPTNN